ncbi:uncharacterized protein BDR25DRAFT_296520 [Lindgomyces ingoldianus]|uniref:Uncharacterized protein n=1 Tax=Lindgomyces ingoldianus TaxID=673940 RepID=A0ACB6QEL9_9PLEO|nr:uncharacterized protein BDR25DRAFT_296520 [Lindgomyces ingoldianus]KAF2464586.1 hypothetical protein BDR25DRAFT_296520 [Lindgomyces ingoldianus]
MPRLGSRKSRNGCKQCKTRHVKCDERVPCSNCTKYGAECSLVSSPALPNLAHGLAKTKITPANHKCTEDHPGTCDWIQDLELMHHYTAHAHLTMPGVEQAKQTWGYAVPQEAFRNPFLMHSLLAFSAYHLAHINPSSQSHYRLLASSHQSSAITGINGVLPSITPENCHALFAAASLITLNSFADSGPKTLDVLIGLFQLLRGMNEVLKTTEPLIQSGPFASIFRPAVDPPRLPPLLSSLLRELQTASSQGPTPESEVAYMAMVNLRDALQSGLENSSHAAMRTAMLWPIKLNGAYIDILRTQEPAAMVVLGQYIKILEYAATEWWFLASWKEFRCNI